MAKTLSSTSGIGAQGEHGPTEGNEVFGVTERPGSLGHHLGDFLDHLRGAVGVAIGAEDIAGQPIEGKAAGRFGEGVGEDGLGVGIETLGHQGLNKDDLPVVAPRAFLHGFADSGRGRGIETLRQLGACGGEVRALSGRSPKAQEGTDGDEDTCR